MALGHGSDNFFYPWGLMEETLGIVIMITFYLLALEPHGGLSYIFIMRTCGVSGGKVYESIGTSLNGVHPQPPAVHQNFHLKFLNFYDFSRYSSTKAGLRLILWICPLSRLQSRHLSWKFHSQMNPNNVNLYNFVVVVVVVRMRLPNSLHVGTETGSQSYLLKIWFSFVWLSANYFKHLSLIMIFSSFENL